MVGNGEKQAAVVVVGNEVLSGDVVDHNGMWLCRELAAIGVEVGIGLTLPDDELLLADYLRQVGARYAPVFVTGGIGTTLDDVTRQAVARAAGVPIVPVGLDFARRAAVIGPLRHPTDSLPDDEAAFRTFFAGITPKRPNLR